jgi:serine protease inhibitor
MDNFMDTINGWIEETEEKIDDCLQTIVLKLGENVVTLSPVDTGRFKGNWQLSIDTTTSASLLREDPDGYLALADMARTANSFTAGQVAYIQNHVLYGYDLEYGSSKQAPDGMLRITAARFVRIVNEAVLLHK